MEAITEVLGGTKTTFVKTTTTTTTTTTYNIENSDINIGDIKELIHQQRKITTIMISTAVTTQQQQ